jgi:transcriptional regulator with XRE-family HTH domain
MSIQERLKIVRKNLKLTQKNAAISIGLNPANFRDLESGKVKISTLHGIALEHIHKINSIWLLTGKGEMFLKQTPSDPEMREEFIKGSLEWSNDSPKKENTGPNTTKKTFDYGLLEQIIEGVEEGLLATETTLPPQKKAELISLLCKYFHESNKDFEPVIIEKYLKLVS